LLNLFSAHCLNVNFFERWGQIVMNLLYHNLILDVFVFEHLLHLRWEGFLIKRLLCGILLCFEFISGFFIGTCFVHHSFEILVVLLMLLLFFLLDFLPFLTFFIKTTPFPSFSITTVVFEDWPVIEVPESGDA